MQFFSTHPKRGFYGLLTIAAVSLGLIVWLMMTTPGIVTPHHRKSGGSTPPSAPPATAVVEITAAGFVPRTLAVQPNTEVVWVNEDTMPHLPAADPYPSHTDLPSLVAPKALGLKETYSFLFTKPGTVPYHDETNPLVTGVVEVR